MADDARWMRAALALAQRGLGQTWPNPAVGAVIVSAGRPVGRGATAPGGRPHAETLAMALAAVGRFDDATRWQRQVVVRREQQEPGPLLERSRRYLALFETGRFVRAPWMDGS